MVKNKPYLLGLYEKAIPSTLNWDEKLEVAKAAGFDYLEISIDETEEKLSRLNDDKTLIEIQTAMRNVGLPILSMCLSGHRKYPLGSHDETVQTKALDIMEKACIFSVKLGIRIIQVAGYDVYYEEHDEDTVRNFTHNLKLCVELASKYGVILAFETMETLFMDTVEKAMVYIDHTNSPYLQIYPDLGNLTNSARMMQLKVEDDLACAQGHIVAAHLKEVIKGKYREIPFGTGDTCFIEALHELKKQGVALFVGEFWYGGNLNWKDDLIYANNYLRKRIEIA